VSPIVQAARSAREKLAAALAMLQTPEAGELIDSVAPPVAAAMGSLHSVERSQGENVKDAIPQALNHVQAALAALQLAPTSNQIVEAATAAVAASLGLVHGMARSPSVTGPVPQVAPAPAPTLAAATGPAPVQEAPPAAVADRSSQPNEPERTASTRAAAGLDRTALSREAPDYSESDKAAERARRKAALAATAQVASTPMETERGTGPINAAAQTPSGAGPSTTADFKDSRHAAPPAEGRPEGSVLVEANLGAHSPTNFFKGLSGNDVVDDGGIFVATYDIPKPGTPLWVRVTLPGGYDFEAAAAVRWTREAGAGDAPPGFGAIFIRLSPEARQLVYRYVRNREPIFYDDM